MGLTVAIAYDDTLVEAGSWRQGADKIIPLLVQAGHRVVLHTVRACPLPDQRPQPDAVQQADQWYGTGLLPLEVEDQWDRFDQMRALLAAAGCWSMVEVWQGRGKPDADIYLDDRSQHPDWLALRRELGLPWLDGL